MADEAKTEIRDTLKPIHLIFASALIVAFAGGALAITAERMRFVGLVAVWLVCGAACGAFLGLLFGVPKRNRDSKGSSIAEPKAGTNPQNTGEAVRPQLVYGGNSNFEEISDWLTKIIVGATLVGLQGTLKAIWQLAKSVLPFGQANQAAGASLVVGAAATGLVGGFISMYLWARNELPRLLNNAEKGGGPDDPLANINRPRDVPPPDKAPEKKVPTEDDMPSAEGATDIATFRPIGQAPWLGEMKGMSEQQVWDTDFNKGKFGGNSTTATRLLSAVVGKISNRYVEVTLAVRSTDPDRYPLKGRVTFYLHPTFFEPIIKVDAVNSRAQTHIFTADAFVVGVECDAGRTMLELDLSTIAGFPSALS
jgi:hypothetical protein